MIFHYIHSLGIRSKSWGAISEFCLPQHSRKTVHPLKDLLQAPGFEEVAKKPNVVRLDVRKQETKDKNQR